MVRTNVVLTNRYAFFPDIDASTFQKLDEFWSYYWPPARYIASHKLYLRQYAIALREGRTDEPIPGWDGKVRFLKNDCCVPAGLFRATKKEAKEKLGIRFKVEYDRPDVEYDEVDGATLDIQKKYEYQVQCVRKMQKAIPRGGGIVLSATGTGKTKIAGDFFSLVSVPCLFVVDLKSLLYQSQKEIEQWLGEPVGVVGDSKYQIQRVTVATIQTLSRHIKDKKFMKWYRRIKIVIVDELHEQLSRRNFKVVEMIDPIARYGLTATLQLGKKPVRMKSYAFAGPVLFRFPYSEGRDTGVLKAGTAVQLLFPEIMALDDYQEAYTEEVVGNTLKRDACVAIVKELIKAGRYVIVLCSRVEHVKNLDKAFSSVPHRLAYGKVSVSTREASKDLFEDGKIQLLIANVVFKKAVNIKRVDAIIDMAEMHSKNDVQQKFGRGVRLHAQKQDLLYIDIGTQKGRFLKNARSRMRALRANDIPVTKNIVNTVATALKAIKAILRAG